MPNLIGGTNTLPQPTTNIGQVEEYTAQSLPHEPVITHNIKGSVILGTRNPMQILKVKQNWEIKFDKMIKSFCFLTDKGGTKWMLANHLDTIKNFIYEIKNSK